MAGVCGLVCLLVMVGYVIGFDRTVKEKGFML